MKVAFRADASLQIGTGHVMRCLTLAEALRERGCECLFIGRQHPGNILELIRHLEFPVAELPCSSDCGSLEFAPGETLLPHSAWLGCDWQTDARQCTEILVPFKPDWLVVDHYALDFRWEEVVQRYARRTLVVDDLADRVHSCDLLLDQNLGRYEGDYRGLLSDQCKLMIGPQYALLRPEFSKLRKYSLKRRATPQLKRILITMGGVDRDNATGLVLKALKGCRLSEDCRIDVVMGASAPWLEKVQEVTTQMPWTTEVSVNVDDMAQRMADADLAIGAAGSTSWERCCLGLPTLMCVLAENQLEIGKALNQKGAAALLGRPSDPDLKAKCTELVDLLLNDGTRLLEMSRAAAAITEGTGSQKVISGILEI